MNPTTEECPSTSSGHSPSTSCPAHRPGQAGRSPSTSSGRSPSTSSPTHRPEQTEHYTGKIKILIVDDREQVRQDLKTALRLMEGLEIVGEAADGLEAVHQAEKLNPDVVLMDLEMPRMDGFEAARQIKDRHLARGVVALTIYGDDSARARAAMVGVDAFVEKGTSIQTLSETIRQVWSQD